MAQETLCLGKENTSNQEKLDKTFLDKYFKLPLLWTQNHHTVTISYDPQLSNHKMKTTHSTVLIMNNLMVPADRMPRCNLLNAARGLIKLFIYMIILQNGLLCAKI